MKIIVADKISERGVALLRETGWNVVLPAKEALLGELADADALLVRSATKVTAALLEQAPKLRVVGRAGSGVDNVDLDAATRRGVLVMNTPGGNAVSVAEHTFALLLALARQVPRLDAALHAGRWEKSSAAQSELRGKTLGVVGFGRIGTEVARRARAFEMRVLVFDPYISEPAVREMQAELVPLNDLLAQSDYVTLHSALNPSTQNLINAATLKLMKHGARLVNAARGELIDEAALAEALQSGQLAGAALDVFAEEPTKNTALVGLPNVIVTPHVAGATAEAQEEVCTQIAQQVREYLTEGVIRNAVNLPAISPEQYKRARPYLVLAERLGSFVSQATAAHASRIRITYAGETAEAGTHLLRSAVLAGLLNGVLADTVNLVNATAMAASRGLTVDERTQRRESGFPNTLEVTALSDAGGGKTHSFSAEATVVHDMAPRILSIDGIGLEAPLDGTILYLRNRDEPGVIGQVGTTLAKQGVNIASFSLGRREAMAGSEAVAVVRLDGEVPDAVVGPIRGIPAVTEARLIRLGKS